VKAFAALYRALDETPKTTEKVEALQRYFADAGPADAAWAIYFLSGRKPRRLVSAPKLRQWTIEASEVPAWLFEECYHAVGDLAETLALLLPTPSGSNDLLLHRWIEERLLPLQTAAEPELREAVLQAWAEMDDQQRFLWNKLLTGNFRVGVSQQLVIRALAQLSGCEAGVIAHRLMGNWEPTPAFY
jgi:DNA ligase-1